MRKLALVLLCAAVGTAGADANKDKADALFKQGKKLMGEKKYADACSAFEQSFKLDPAIGGELNVARCYEEWGKLGRALDAYKHAEQMATDAKDARASKIHDLVTGLDPQVPRLTLKLPKNADPAQVNATVDGAPVAATALGAPQVVDTGPHTIEWVGAGGAKKKKVVAVERGGSAEVTLADAIVLASAVDLHVKPDKPEPVEPAADPGHGRRMLAYGAAGGGVVLMGVSTYLAISARSSYNDAISHHCNGSPDNCDAAGLSATHDARSKANLGTVVFIVGAAAVGGGVALYLTAPKAGSSSEHAMWIVPTASPQGGGLVLGGSL